MNIDEIKQIIKKVYKNDKSIKIISEQIDRFYNIASSFNSLKHNYKVGDLVKLKKGTLIHGTYKGLDGFSDIVKNGLISSDIIDDRKSKYPACVGVWNLKKDYNLKDYINFYSGGTIEIRELKGKSKTRVVSYDDMDNIMEELTKDNNCFRWFMEQTKEARFLPSLVQDKIQIGIIFNGNNKYAKELLKGDILNPKNINNSDVVEFVNPDYYEKFIKDRKNKDDFFTDRESAILYGIPSNLIEGILVGRKYEKNKTILREIKKLLPNAYICNLDGVIINT